jgi:hypothetical protein
MAAFAVPAGMTLTECGRRATRRPRAQACPLLPRALAAYAGPWGPVGGRPGQRRGEGRALMNERTRETRARERREHHTEEQIVVRQVTHVQASWTEAERGASGAFTLQLILDNGVTEYVLRPTAADLQALLQLFQQSGTAMFDSGRKVLMFSDLPART